MTLCVCVCVYTHLGVYVVIGTILGRRHNLLRAHFTFPQAPHCHISFILSNLNENVYSYLNWKRLHLLGTALTDSCPFACLPLIGMAASWVLGLAVLSLLWFIFPPLLPNKTQCTENPWPCFLGTHMEFSQGLWVCQAFSPLLGAPIAASICHTLHIALPWFHGLRILSTYLPLPSPEWTISYICQMNALWLFLILVLKFWSFGLDIHISTGIIKSKGVICHPDVQREDPPHKTDVFDYSVQLAHVNLLHCLEILSCAKDLTTHKQAHCCPNRWTREIGKPKPMDEHEMNWCREAKGIGYEC